MAFMAKQEPASSRRTESVGPHEGAHEDTADEKSMSEPGLRTANPVKLLEKLKGGAQQSPNELFNSLLMA